MSPFGAYFEFEALLDYLKHNQGCDLTGYKRSTLMRRFEYRMQRLKIDSYQGYLQYLQDHSQEYLALLDDVLINVSSFFRDREAWDYLATDIIPQIIASKEPHEQIRVWSAGCAVGQEIYSLLILLAEALGIDSCLERVQCFATDADEAALRQARRATFSALEITGIPPDLLEKYFERTEKGYLFHQELRRTIVFGRHDLAKDAPISKIDLLVCRNVLIYFNVETQAVLLVRFHFALKTDSFLFLGKSEMLTHHKQIFTPFNLKYRIYSKGRNLQLEELQSVYFKARQKQSGIPLSTQSRFWHTAFETSSDALLAVDINGCLIGANEQANLLFRLTLDDRNRLFQELEPGKLISYHTSMSKFYNQRFPRTLQSIKWNTSKNTKYFDVVITPVFNFEKKLLGAVLTFIDKTIDYE